MGQQSTYCEYVKNLPEEHIQKQYHDNRYGFPTKDDNKLFGRLVLEINQAGLSWEIILKKEENFRRAFDDFNIKTISQYSDLKRNQLLNDKGIIRNRLKIDAVIYNAKQVISIIDEYNSFKNWLDYNHPKEKSDWVKLFKKHFKFTGGEIVGEFLMSTGYLPGAHTEGCPVFKKTILAGAPWYGRNV